MPNREKLSKARPRIHSHFYQSKKDKAIRAMLLPPEPVLRANGIYTRSLTTLKNIKWGAWSLIALYISLFSGVVVGLQYDYETPAYSTAALDLLAPFGSFFRSLHFFSSQFFFFFCCIHLIVTYNKTDNQSQFEWLRLIATLPVILLLLFTGYILRGDNTGFSAGMIGENIMLAIPFLGSSFNDLFFSLSENGLRKVYLHHVISLDVVLLILAWNHLRIYRVTVVHYVALIGAMLLFSVFIAAPFEQEHLGVSYISGPWFFLGLQELLRYLPPLIAGVIVPGIFLLSLFGGHPSNSKSRALLFGASIWLIAYAILSIIAWLR